MKFILLVFSISVFLIAWGFFNLKNSANNKLISLVDAKQLALYDIENKSVVTGNIDVIKTNTERMVAVNDDNLDDTLESVELLDLSELSANNG